MPNTTFQKIVKPFLTNKGCITNDCNSIKKDVDIIGEEQLLVELFNEDYVSLVGTSSGNKPSSLINSEDSAQGDFTFDKIISKYNAHPSVQIFKGNFLQIYYANAITCSNIITRCEICPKLTRNKPERRQR